MTVLNRKLIERMVNPQPGGNGGGAGGGYTTPYVLPAASSSELGGIKLGYPTGTGKNYPVVLDSNNRAYVNVEWTDHTYSASDGVSLDGTTFKNSGVRGVSIYGNYLRVNTNGSNADLTIPYASSAGSATTAGTATYANSAGSASSAGYATSAGSADYATSAGSAGYASYITDGTMDAIAQYNNELNFGGSDGSSTIYFGYRARGSKGIPTSFVFGGGSGSASVTCARVYSNGGVTALSDARKKNVLGDVELSVDDIARMPAVRFRWKDLDQAGTFIGTLAQPWREILPEAVQPIGDNIGFDYNGAAIVAVVNLAKAVQKIIEKMNRYGFK